ncbi:TrfB-related DNA-binding protein [Vreelandella rituensis]|uniref:TrfB transcriptional repressor protein domain-containing protein n=1 Tax=Vreelandella rituensis TaxID=2282306 RepID=A0A368UAW7_9GAMM|nr:TrfB-related DNA-binding protein [Halomonas rituensis]RCV93677.1 hypothetical protein DU506_00540 [Halomonas rituensis]
MTPGQFATIAKLIRGDTASPSAQAARLVLVDGLAQAEAMRATGASRNAVYNAVHRYQNAYALICEHFTTGRHKPPTNP